MANKPPIQVGVSRRFLKDLNRLEKKYPLVRFDVAVLIQKLEQGETPGDQIRGTGYTAYKTRIPNSSSKRGKSGGYRVIYYIETEDAVALMTIYSKTDQEDISEHEIRHIVEHYLQE